MAATLENPPVIPVDFDLWRASYDYASFSQHRETYDVVGESVPNQNHADLDALNHAFGGVRTVTELGGWDGSTADLLLRHHPRLDRWVNYEICGWAVGDGNQCEDDRYRGVGLEDWPWQVELEPADILVASHVVEHMRFDQFRLLSDQFGRFRRLHFQVPVPLVGDPCWDGYPGMHILEVGWERLELFLVGLGWRLVQAGPMTCRTYEH